MTQFPHNIEKHQRIKEQLYYAKDYETQQKTGKSLTIRGAGIINNKAQRSFIARTCLVETAEQVHSNSYQSYPSAEESYDISVT
mmetsp:Transcript_13624/g.21068  ORF Transcript_13624/g.21068 Transcript_13624/m.21068 type:complete len:84 (-) Transcript_13624:242-493(-)